MIKAHFSGRMVSSGISNVGFTSVCSEKTSPKKLMMMNLIIIIIIIINKLQETTFFRRRQKLISAMKLRPESDDRLLI